MLRPGSWFKKRASWFEKHRAPVRWFEKGEDGKSVDVTVGADWKILLSTALPFDAQAERLGVVLKEKIGARAADLDYVDLRYNEKIYFRMKGGGETP